MAIPAAQGSALASPKILIVDDEEAILKLLKAILSRSRYEVTTALSGSEALGLLGETQFDCVLTDAVMPEMDGYAFIKAARSDPRYAETPILMLTRKRHRQDVKAAVEAGVTDYILKPIDEDLLLEKIESSIKRRGKGASQEQPHANRVTDGEMSVGCKIISLTETELVLRLPLRIEATIPFQLRCRIFDEIGINQPSLKVEQCDFALDDGSHADYPWKAKLSFATAPEADLQKVRAWLQKRGGH